MKVKKRTRIINAVAGKDWGWEWESLRTLYKVMVESCTWYAAAGWMPWITKTGMRKIETAPKRSAEESDRTGQIYTYRLYLSGSKR